MYATHKMQDKKEEKRMRSVLWSKFLRDGEIEIKSKLEIHLKGKVGEKEGWTEEEKKMFYAKLRY